MQVGIIGPVRVPSPRPAVCKVLDLPLLDETDMKAAIADLAARLNACIEALHNAGLATP